MERLGNLERASAQNVNTCSLRSRQEGKLEGLVEIRSQRTLAFKNNFVLSYMLYVYISFIYLFGCTGSSLQHVRS